ncbi:MAG TPA: hypothetical protein VGD05_00050 [Pyrinomonadaceae bacterium]|jgi:predicted  nucleic acid-binding Zn-ribbon protein
MKCNFIVLASTILFSLPFVYAQQNQLPPAANQQNAISPDAVVNISIDLAIISKSVQNLNKSLKEFFDKFSSNQGLQLSEKQQKLLLAFEILNRSEQRLAILHKLRIDLAEKQTSVKTLLAKIEDDLREEKISRSVAFEGTTNAELSRENRRRFLSSELNSLTSLLGEIQNTLTETNSEIRQLESFVRSIRQKVFPEVIRELYEL